MIEMNFRENQMHSNCSNLVIYDPNSSRFSKRKLEMMETLVPRKKERKRESKDPKLKYNRT